MKKRRMAMKRIVASGLALGCLMLLSGPANTWAGDCGGAGPACVCGDTVNVDHTLPGDLTCVLPQVNGLIIKAGIVLNLGGHDLTGPGPDTGGVGVQLNTDSKVKNGRIQNFGTGIGSVNDITGCGIANDPTVPALTPLVVTINGVGIDLHADDCTIFKATIVANEGNGVTVAGNGNKLIQNTCSRNGGDGLSVVGDNNMLISNRCELNDGHGIVVDGNVNTLEKNLGGRNEGSGVTADGDGNKFFRNQGRTNLVDGVRGTGSNLETDGKNYGNANGGVNCEIDDHDSTGGGKYC
jgi:hypothetical protein